MTLCGTLRHLIQCWLYLSINNKKKLPSDSNCTNIPEFDYIKPKRSRYRVDDLFPLKIRKKIHRKLELWRERSLVFDSRTGKYFFSSLYPIVYRESTWISERNQAKKKRKTNKHTRNKIANNLKSRHRNFLEKWDFFLF